MERFWRLVGLIPNPLNLGRAPLGVKLALAAYLGACIFVNLFMKPLLFLDIFFSWVPTAVLGFYAVFLASLPMLMRLKVRSRRTGGGR